MAGMQFTQIVFIQQLPCSNLATLHECPYLFCVFIYAINPLRREKEDRMKTTGKRARKAKEPVFEAVFTQEQMNEYEQKAQGFGVARRITTAVLTRSSKEMIEGFKDSPDVLLESIEAIHVYMKHLEAAREMAECARARLLSVGKSTIGGVA